MTNKSKLVSLALASLLSFSVSFSSVISAQEKQNKAPHYLGFMYYPHSKGIIRVLLYDMSGDGFADSGVGSFPNSDKVFYWKDKDNDRKIDDSEFVSWNKSLLG